MYRQIVVGTTPDYIQLIKDRYPNRVLFIDSFVDVENIQDYPINGVVCFDCDALFDASKIADKLGVSFVSRDAIKICRSKELLFKVWSNKKIKCANKKKVNQVSDLDGMDYPIILKPVFGTGSEHVYLCRNLRELQHCLSLIPVGDVLAEQFLQGDEYSCDFVVVNGRVKILRFTKKIIDNGYGFGTALAYIIESEILPNLERQLLAAANAIGLANTIIMADFIFSNGHVYFLEMTPRPGGDCLPDLARESLGYDVLGLALDFSVDQSISLPDYRKGLKKVALRLFAEKAGTLQKIDFDYVEQDERVEKVFANYKKGHKISLPPLDYDSRKLGHMIFNPEPNRDIGVQCRELLKKVEVEIGD